MPLGLEVEKGRSWDRMPFAAVRTGRVERGPRQHITDMLGEIVMDLLMGGRSWRLVGRRKSICWRRRADPRATSRRVFNSIPSNLLRTPQPTHTLLLTRAFARSTDKMTGASLRMRSLQSKLLKARIGSGAVVLPKDIKRIHMSFAKPVTAAHIGPKWADPRSSNTCVF